MMQVIFYYVVSEYLQTDVSDVIVSVDKVFVSELIILIMTSCFLRIYAVWSVMACDSYICLFI